MRGILWQKDGATPNTTKVVMWYRNLGRKSSSCMQMLTGPAVRSILMSWMSGSGVLAKTQVYRRDPKSLAEVMECKKRYLFS
jgi:hypothetical protein